MEGMSVTRIIGIIILIAAAVGILYVTLNYFGIGIPPVFLTIALIVAVAAFALLALYFLARLWTKLP